MPIYGFHCDDCSNEFETLVRASDTVECPSCGGAHLTRMLSLIAKPNSGGEAGGGRAVASDAPPCVSGACRFGGGCG